MTENAAPLEEVMVAMDVVDTLRHQQDLVDRELDEEGRRERLLARLKDLYQAQGIDVPDHVLQEGIAALEEERFQYKATPSSWKTRIARAWISRGRWGKPAGFLAVIASLFSGVYIATDVLPERELRKNLPSQLESTLASIETHAINKDVVSDARITVNRGKAAIQENRIDDAEAVLEGMQRVEALLQTHYTLRVVSRKNERSGVFRIPDVNENARNYYLIIEAVDQKNNIVEVDILDEEKNELKRVKKWGVRVNKETYDRIAADKRDDGIIQNNKVGEKPVGYLHAQYSIPTTGGAITSW